MLKIRKMNRHLTEMWICRGGSQYLAPAYVSQLLILVLQKCLSAKCQWDRGSLACLSVEAFTAGIIGFPQYSSHVIQFKLTWDLFTRRKKKLLAVFRTCEIVNIKITCSLHGLIKYLRVKNFQYHQKNRKSIKNNFIAPLLGWRKANCGLNG